MSAADGPGEAGVGRLLTVLEAEERLYLELRDLLQRERELLAALDAAGLEQAVQRKASLAEEGRLLEESRVLVATQLAESLGIAVERQPTLSQLCDSLGPERDAGLRDAHSRLLALVGAVQELLAANAGFAGEAQAQVRATLRLLGRLVPEAATYGPDGPRGGELPLPGGRLLERRA